MGKIVSSADAINHGLPTPEDMHFALRTLTSLGLIVPNGYQTFITPSGAAMVEAALSQIVGTDSSASKISALSKMLVTGEKLPLSVDLESRLPTTSNIREAIESYRENARRASGVSLEATNVMHTQLFTQSAIYRPFRQRVSATISHLLKRRDA